MNTLSKAAVGGIITTTAPTALVGTSGPDGCDFRLVR